MTNNDNIDELFDLIWIRAVGACNLDDVEEEDRETGYINIQTKTRKEAKAKLQQMLVEADLEARINELGHIHCCDNEPVVGYGDDSINVCSADHQKRIADLNSQLKERK